MSPAAVSSARSTWSCSSAANNDFEHFRRTCRAKQRHPIFTGPLMGDVLASQSPTRRTASTSGCRRVSSSTHRSATASVSASMAAPWIERRRRRVGRLHALPLDRRRFGRRACDCRFRREDLRCRRALLAPMPLDGLTARPYQHRYFEHRDSGQRN
jgi:hypothetical protein